MGGRPGSKDAGIRACPSRILGAGVAGGILAGGWEPILVLCSRSFLPTPLSLHPCTSLLDGNKKRF